MVPGRPVRGPHEPRPGQHLTDPAPPPPPPDPPADPPSNVIVPLKLDAFVFNSAVCSGGHLDAKIAPITQPNYTFLRLDQFVVQNDILDHVDMHLTSPSGYNPRFTDLGTHQTRQGRVGVYLHWMIPRAYRSGTTATQSAQPNQPAQRRKKGFRDVPSEDADHTVPDFAFVPPRWLVIRRVDPATVAPVGAVFPEVQAWVVESDRLRDLNDLGPEVDLQVDVSPFVSPGDKIDIGRQAEVFIGYKEDAKTWNESTVPRVPLSLLNSSNHLFADYQPHNSNVFSIVDNFAYTDAGGTQYLTAATASYYVIGWHADEDQDLFHMTDNSVTLKQRLDACLMAFKDPSAPDIPAWAKSSDSANLLCHGAMYDVEWSSIDKPKNVPADGYSQLINNNMPIAVGTTPLESLLTFIQAHVGTDTGLIKQLEEDIIRIQTLLLAQDDSVEAQRAAGDELQNQNFHRADCGTHWYLAGTDAGQPTLPSDDEIKKLAALNTAQLAWDVTARTVARLQWDMFSLWWKYVSEIDHTSDPQLAQEVAALTKRVNGLKTSMDALGQEIEGLKFPLAKPGVMPPVFQQRDPTLVVGGVESGWPHDYLDKLAVRLAPEIVTGDPGSLPTGWSDLLDLVVPKLPAAIQKSARALAGEFLLLRPDRPAVDPPPGGEVLPLYHDQGWNPDKDKDALWRDRWGSTQPWFPLFLEWEAEYTHIPYKDWTLDERTTRQSAAKKLQYGIDDQYVLKDLNIEDQRTVSGRILILPQPNFSLQTKIDQLFANTPPSILDIYFPKAERDRLQKELYKLAFLSSPLSGLTDHLLTLIQGSHIKPNKRPPGETIQPIEEAVTVGQSVGLGTEQIVLIDKESDMTPYGTLVQFLDERFCAFKPVTHGQFRFTKLNIFDKFGQAISAIDPSVEPPQPLYPCISDYYACQLVKGTTDEANTVVEDAPGMCEFVQMPPQINQPARLNAVFVKNDLAQGGNAYWRPVTEWENPIWGWVVINYAEYGIQLFLPDGTFYREVRIGGPGGSNLPPAWLPFEPPPHTPPEAAQLDLLIAKLVDPNNPAYLTAFIDMINMAAASAPVAPAAYSQFLNSIVGKPLALVNMGLSLELATDAYVNQSTLDTTEQPMWLLPGIKREVYGFHVKLGDMDRTYDGLVGYFDTLPKPVPGNELDLSKLYTYFSTLPPAAGSPVHPISAADYPVFNPFWIPPDAVSSGNITDPSLIVAARNSCLTAFGALVDPFTPIHGYSSFLPPTSLTLPPWTWQSAMNRMTAFFHMGPLMITADVPAYDPKYQLQPNYDLKTATVVPGSAVPIPALGVADWNWLQPYVDAGGDSVFSPLGLGKLDNRPRFEKGPYVAVEGYLQLRKPIVRPE